MPKSQEAADCKLTPKRRIKQRRTFLAVQNKGKRLSSSSLLIFVLANKSANSRLGVTVSTKVDKRAVVRNRIKRLVREVFRTNRHRLITNIDLVVIAKQSATRLDLAECSRQMLACLQQHGFLHRLA